MTDVPRKNDLEDRLADLPVLPSLVSRLMALDMNAETSFDEVVAIAEEEPSFAIRVLSMANSVLLAPNQEITSIPQAVARVGARRISELCSSMAMLTTFPPSTRQQREVWLDAIQVAVGARRIAGAIPGCGVEPQDAYMVGLLHDFGRIVLEDFEGEEVQHTDEVRLTQSESLVGIEEELLGFSHADAGALALERWGLPSALAGYVRNHHRYQVDAGQVESTLMLQIVQVADRLSVRLQLNPRSVRSDGLASLLELTKDTLSEHPNFPLDRNQLADLAPGIRAETVDLALGLGI